MNKISEPTESVKIPTSVMNKVRKYKEKTGIIQVRFIADAINKELKNLKTKNK